MPLGGSWRSVGFQDQMLTIVVERVRRLVTLKRVASKSLRENGLRLATEKFPSNAHKTSKMELFREFVAEITPQLLTRVSVNAF